MSKATPIWALTPRPAPLQDSPRTFDVLLLPHEVVCIQLRYFNLFHIPKANLRDKHELDNALLRCISWANGPRKHQIFWFITSKSAQFSVVIHGDNDESPRPTRTVSWLLNFHRSFKHLGVDQNSEIPLLRHRVLFVDMLLHRSLGIPKIHHIPWVRLLDHQCPQKLLVMQCYAHIGLPMFASLSQLE